MKRLVPLFLLLFRGVTSLAQLEGVAWQRVLGGSGHEEAYDMINTLDGGLLIVGYTTSSNNGDIEGSNRGGQDFWIVKLDNASPPNIQWEKNYGGYKDDVAYKAIQDNESGHYTVIGKTNSGRSGDITYDSIGGFDYWMIELDMNGTIVRDTLFGTSKLDGYNNKKLDDFTQIELLQSRDQKHLVFLGDIGKTSINPADIDIWWIKMDRENWFDSSSIEKKYNQYEPENQYNGTLVSGLLELSNNSYILISNAADFYNKDQYWLLKIDSNGIYQTDRMVGGTKDDYPRDAILDDRGDIVVVGQSNSSDIDHKSGVYWSIAGYPSLDFWVVKFDSSNLNIIWEKSYGGMLREDIGRKIVQAEDGGYYLAGRFWGDKHTGDICGHHSALLKISRDGDIEWSTAVGNSGSTFGFYNLVLQNGFPVASGYSDGGGDIDPSQFHGGIDI